MSISPTIVQSIMTHLQELPDLAGMNVATLVAEGMKFIQQMQSPLTLVEKKQALLVAFERIAAGADGALGTADDVIPADIVQKIKLLLDNQIMDGFMDVLSEHSISEVATEVAATAKSCFSCFGRR